ncbi:MAG: STAS domain-containing protein [Spirochaetaceae bacterium]|nr:MAG: STAS domain-containing protein [Spirochaetaceae bacterium]
MLVRNERSKEEVQLRVEGPLDSEAAEAFQKELSTLAAGDYKTITLDLSEVPSINSTCIGKILLLRKSLTEQERMIRINGCSEAVYNTFQLIKFDRLVNIDR